MNNWACSCKETQHFTIPSSHNKISHYETLTYYTTRKENPYLNTLSTEKVTDQVPVYSSTPAYYSDYTIHGCDCNSCKCKYCESKFIFNDNETYSLIRR